MSPRAKAPTVATGAKVMTSLGGSVGYDPAVLRQYGYSGDEMFFVSPTDEYGNPIPGVGMPQTQTVFVPGRKFDSTRDSTMFNGPSGDGYPMTSKVLQDGSRMDTYANGVALTDANGRSYFQVMDVSDTSLSGVTSGVRTAASRCPFKVVFSNSAREFGPGNACLCTNQLTTRCRIEQFGIFKAKVPTATSQWPKIFSNFS